MSNSTTFKEHRTYRHTETRTDVEFYFITRIYNEYVLDLFSELERTPPDILIINSALWDLHRYGRLADNKYRDNIEKAASRLEKIMTKKDNGARRLLVWSMSMPVSSQSHSGFVDRNFEGTVGGGVNVANQAAKSVMRQHGAEVIDFFQLFEGQLHHRVRDGVHWDAIAHRRITNYILLLVANHLYGRDHPKSIKAKKILAGSPLSDTPIAVPRRRPWLRSLPSSPSAFLFTPAVSEVSQVSQDTKENNKSDKKEALLYASPHFKSTTTDLRKVLQKRKRARSRSPSPSYKTDLKRPRRGFESSQNYYASSKSPAARVVSYVKRGWQRVKGFFKRHEMPDRRVVTFQRHQARQSYYNNWHYW